MFSRPISPPVVKAPWYTLPCLAPLLRALPQTLSFLLSFRPELSWTFSEGTAHHHHMSSHSVGDFTLQFAMLTNSQSSDCLVHHKVYTYPKGLFSSMTFDDHMMSPALPHRFLTAGNVSYRFTFACCDFALQHYNVGFHTPPYSGC